MLGYSYCWKHPYWNTWRGTFKNPGKRWENHHYLNINLNELWLFSLVHMFLLGGFPFFWFSPRPSGKRNPFWLSQIYTRWKLHQWITLKDDGPCFKGISVFWNMASCWRFSAQARHVGSWFLQQDSRTGGKSLGQLKRMELWTWEEGLRFLKICNYISCIYIYISIFKWYSASDVNGNLCCQFLWVLLHYSCKSLSTGAKGRTLQAEFSQAPKVLAGSSHEISA